MNRRDLLKYGIGAFGLGLLGNRSPLRADFNKDIPLCLQLYTVGGVSDDPAKRFAEVASFGYKGVEYAGYGGRGAEELRKFQDDAGLFCTGSHCGRDQFEDSENLKAQIGFLNTIGAKFLICTWMTNDGVDGWKQAAENLTKAADIAEKSGIMVAYHAHPHDFNIIDEANQLTSWEVFANNSGENVVLQIDLGHCVNAGADPCKMIKKYPGRSKSVHLRESDGKIIGEGGIDWAEVFHLLESIGGAMTYTVEYDADMDRMEASRLSAEAYYKIHG
ncbi:MAG: sugar phosphate isomerase/epimerase [Thermoguttaceae bacterium]|nr:sugar phosphate isomerase/epimerase [Thermoguttaceae bacterium]